MKQQEEEVGIRGKRSKGRKRRTKRRSKGRTSYSGMQSVLGVDLTVQLSLHATLCQMDEFMRPCFMLGE